MARKSSGGSFGWLGPVKEAGAPSRSEPRDSGHDRQSYEVPGASARPKRTRNRAKTGKRSNPNYVMAGAYIERGVREQVDRALAEMRKPGGKKVEYSDLVQSLLVRWLGEVGHPLEEAAPRDQAESG